MSILAYIPANSWPEKLAVAFWFALSFFVLYKIVWALIRFIRSGRIKDSWGWHPQQLWLTKKAMALIRRTNTPPLKERLHAFRTAKTRNETIASHPRQ